MWYLYYIYDQFLFEFCDLNIKTQQYLISILLIDSVLYTGILCLLSNIFALFNTLFIFLNIFFINNNIN